MAHDFYVIECAAENVFAEFYLNDIPLFVRGPVLGIYADSPVNQYTVDGVNTLSILVRPGPTPAEARSGENGEKTIVQPKGDKAHVRLVGYPYGALSGGDEGQELLRLDWNGHEEDEFEFPLELSARVDLGEIHGPWCWQDAPILELNDDTRKSVHEFLEAARKDLAAANAEAHIDRVRLHLRELARAYDSRASTKMNLIRTSLAEDKAQPGFGFEELDPESYSLRLCAGGRLIQCVGKDWEPLIKQLPGPDGDTASYEMMIAKIDGEWKVVR